jgi:uncharacterized protein
LNDRILVIYHANCWDGFCAAWLVTRFYDAHAELFPGFYGTDPPDCSDRDVLILDFSYPREALVEMRAQSRSCLVLDHHKTSEEALAGLDYAKFDPNLSGAQMTWKWLGTIRTEQPEAPPWLVPYTADRDFWKWELPHSKEINACLRSYPLDLGVWDQLARMNPNDLVSQGAAILRAEEQIVTTHLDFASEIEIDGHRVLSVNATVLFSEIAGRLSQGRPFGVAWFERADGKRQFSLRSTPEGIDVSEIAKAHGGGGHKHAAGFEV